MVVNPLDDVLTFNPAEETNIVESDDDIHTPLTDPRLIELFSRKPPAPTRTISHYYELPDVPDGPSMPAPPFSSHPPLEGKEISQSFSNISSRLR